MTTLTLRRLFALVVLAGTAVLAGCNATGKWKHVGEPPNWKDTSELPVPNDGSTDPNTLRIVLQCPTIEENDEFVGQLKEAILAKCRNSPGMGEVKLLPKGSQKKAHYEILVYEAGEDGKFAFNTEAGIWAGLGTGVATGVLTENLGYGLGAGVAGGAAAGFLAGDKKNVWAFAGICRQRTSLEATKTADTDNKNRTNVGGGTRDQDTGNAATGGTKREMFERAQWNMKTSSFEFPFMFQIAVEGGALTNLGKRTECARETFLKKFPGYITGGTAIGG